MRGRRWLVSAVVLTAAVVSSCSSTPATPVPATIPPAPASFSPISTSAVASVSPSVSMSASVPVPVPVPVSASASASVPVSVSVLVSAPSTAATSGSTTSTPTTPTSTTPTSTTPTSTTPAATVALPAVDLAGVNVPGCRSADRPVVLLHGSFSTVGSNFSALVPALRATGRCVYGLNYGNGGIAAVTSSAGQASALVTAVLTDTGAGAVDVIAYSQGGLVLRTALRLDGIADQVSTAVLIAPSWNGTTSRAAASAPAVLCPACADQVAGSALLRRLSAGGDLDGSVRYAEISTRADIVVTPVSSQVPTGPPDRVRSVVLEDVCPQVVADHVHLPAVSGVVRWTVSALETDGRPPDSAVDC